MNPSPPAIAAIIDSRCVIVNRGRRENLKIKTIYQISETHPLALLEVFQVAEKFALCRPIWVDPRCPVIKKGLRIKEFVLGVGNGQTEPD